MRVITEYDLKGELKNKKVDKIFIGENDRLTVSAREFLAARDIAVEIKGTVSEKKDDSCDNTGANSEPQRSEAKYEDYYTGSVYYEKPENMTHLMGNLLVEKDNPRIQFRGKMDRLQADIVLAQTLSEKEGNHNLTEDLQDVLVACYKIMESDVSDKDMEQFDIIGLNHEEIREHSHHPMKYYKIKQLLLPHYSMGNMYAHLNCLRAEIREAEIYAIRAFKEGKKNSKMDIVQTLNRLSSVMHIIQCRYLADYYKTNKKKGQI